VVTIYHTEQKPHQLRENGAFYIRRGSTTDIMRKEEIASMLQDTGLLSYELLPVINASIEDLDIKKTEDYLIKSGLPPKATDEILIGTGIASKEKDYTEIHPTCGGILLFGKHPYSFMPHAVIKINNSHNSKIPRYHISKGTIVEMLEDACAFIEECITDNNFPIAVINEFIIKAVMHRDYFDINNFIEVFINKNNIEIINPGTAVKEVNNSNKYIRRNLWLYIKLITIDKDKKFFNRDINVNQLIGEYGRIKYYNITSKNLFKVIIPLIKQSRQAKNL
jgi:predicted HTH transcriptional regulator